MSDLIQGVLAEGFNKELNEAKTNLKLLKDEFYETVNAAVALRNATGASGSFVDYNKNVNAAVQLQKNLADNVDKTAKAEARLAQEQEKAYNKYLAQLAKQQQEEDKAAAQRLALIEKENQAREAAAAKRAKLNEDDERFNRSSFQSNQTYEVGPATYSPGNGTAVPDAGAAQNAQSANIAGIGAATTATNENTAAKIANAQATEESDAALIQNINFNNELRAELAIVTQQIKDKGVFDAELTAQQLRLNQAIRENQQLINQQIKLENAATGSNNEARAQLEVLRLEYVQLTAAERANQEIGGKKLAQIQQLAPAVSKSAADLGKFGDNVGNYPVSAIDKVIGRFDSLDKIGARVLSNLARHAISFGTSFFVFTAISKGFELLTNYISELDIFSKSLTEAEVRQKAFGEAFKGSDYQTAIKNVYELGENIKLANEGFLDKDKVVDQYNESIGKVTGRVDTLNDVEAVYTKNAAQYIAVTLQKAAANIILADAAKDAAETAQKNQEIQEAGIEAQKKLNLLQKLPDAGTSRNSDAQSSIQNEIGAIADGIKSGQEKIEKNTKDFQDRQKARMAQIGKIGDLVGANGGGGLGTDNTGVAAQAKIENDLANNKFEQQKKAAQAIIDNDKLSYEKRIQATKDFQYATLQIANNNEGLALKDKTLSNDQKLKLENDYQNAVLDAINQGNKKRKELRDAQAKDNLAILKQDIEDAKTNDKSIYLNKQNSFSDRLKAVDKYEADSKRLIKVAENAALKDAGEVEEKKILIRKQFADQAKQAETEANTERYNIHKEQLEAILAADKAAADDAIGILNQVNDKAISMLQAQRDKEIAVLEDKHKRGRISKIKYNADLLAIDDQYDIDRLGQIAFNEQSILEVLQAKQQADVDAAKKAGAPQSEIDKIVSNSGVNGQAQKVASAGQNLQNAISKQGKDETKSADEAKQERIKEITKGVADLQELQDDASKILQANYQAEIDLLQKKSELIQQQAQDQIDAENRSLDSAKTKADKIAIINAKAAAQQKLITEQENQIKRKQAEADRAASIAKIIENTAVAVVAALADGPISGEILAGIVAALGAAQLAVVLATPIPAFVHGGEMPYTGIAQFGEAGQELRIEPGGDTSLTPGTTTRGIVKKGTRFVDANTTTKLLTRPDDFSKYVGGQEISVKELERLMSKVAKNTEPQGSVKVKNSIPQHWNTDYFRSKIN